MPYIPPTTHVTLLATLRRQRLLPVAGDVVVNLNQRVEASDIIARALVPKEHRLLDVARGLGRPKEKADAHLVRKDGDPLKKGEPIALRKGFLGLGKRSVLSPVDGFLLVAGDGKALVAATEAPFELRAGVPGVVVEVFDERGLTIETTGALVEGVWGNGQSDFAVMRMVSSKPDEVLAPEQIEMSLRGAVLAAGTLQDEATLAQLANVRIRGLIIGSLNVDLIPAVEKLDLPVVVTDSFGGLGFSVAVFNLLTGNDGREVSINARPWDRFAGSRPEVLISLPTPGQSPPPPPDGEALSVGKRVRIVRGPDSGKTGTINALSDKAVLIPCGLRTRVAAVNLTDPPGPAVSIPFANLEILE